MCASMAIDALKRRGKSVVSDTNRNNAKNRTMRLLLALDLLPKDMPDTKRREIEEHVLYCEDMHALGMRGNLK